MKVTAYGSTPLPAVCVCGCACVREGTRTNLQLKALSRPGKCKMVPLSASQPTDTSLSYDVTPVCAYSPGIQTIFGWQI